MNCKKIFISKERKVFIDTYIIEDSKNFQHNLIRPVVIICPGGGYSHLAMNHEGLDWAPFFNNMGIAAVVLHYRMPNGNHKVPVEDAEAAIQLVRANAKSWNINPDAVGIMGSSAG